MIAAHRPQHQRRERRRRPRRRGNGWQEWVGDGRDMAIIWSITALGLVIHPNNQDFRNAFTVFTPALAGNVVAYQTREKRCRADEYEADDDD